MFANDIDRRMLNTYNYLDSLTIDQIKYIYEFFFDVHNFQNLDYKNITAHLARLFSTETSSLNREIVNKYLILFQKKFLELKKISDQIMHGSDELSIVKFTTILIFFLDNCKAGVNIIDNYTKTQQQTKEFGLLGDKPVEMKQVFAFSDVTPIKYKNENNDVSINLNDMSEQDLKELFEKHKMPIINLVKEYIENNFPRTKNIGVQINFLFPQKNKN